MGKLQKEQEALAEQSSAGHDLAPPEYAAAASDDSNAPDAPPPGYTPGPSPYEKVPVGWNLYYKAWSMRTFHIGPHADQPVFALELHSGLLSSRPFLILFDGADAKTAPRIATAHRDGLMKGHAAITVPGAAAPEKLTVHSRRMNFSFNVGSGKETRREDFEWRYSHGKEVKVLDRWGRGWKLVRLGADGGGGGGGEGQDKVGRSARPHGESSDGHPVVAVFADNSKWSKTKVARFHFVGAGATDEFGEPWAMFVTMSALRIWELMMNARASAAGAA